MALFATLKDGFDFGIQRDVRLRKAVDEITLAGMLRGSGLQGEMEKAADVIVLVKDAKHAFGFLTGEPKGSQGQRTSEAAGELAISFDQVT